MTSLEVLLGRTPSLLKFLAPRPAAQPPAPALVEAPPTLPFITLSRQVGAGSMSLPERLAESLNAGRNTLPPWRSWDRELVDRLAAELHLSPEPVERLETSHHSWLDDFFAGLVGEPDELAIVYGITRTVRALAGSGHVVLVGHGPLYMTRGLPRGIHVHLVAPLAARIDNLARWMNVPRKEAARRLRSMERNRRAFLRRYWPGQKVESEMLAATFNTAVVSEDCLIQCIRCLVAE